MEKVIWNLMWLAVWAWSPGLSGRPGNSAAADMPWIRVAPEGEHFSRGDSGKPFVPWGFNYDHDREGRLLEEYWHDRWSVVESDFQEMKMLGANVVRIHLQFAAFMESPLLPRQSSLDQLARLLELAERTELYLDLTGLGCYHKQDVPPWYDALNEQDRWKAQAVFWEAIARVCADSPAIFCYDLMNEPVVPGGDARREEWLGPGFGGKHFTQFVALERAGRERTAIARAWIQMLVAAIRRHDPRHLVTVGLVPWSLDRDGLTSGFVPEAVAPDLDFIAVHLYPETGKLDGAVETLQGFVVPGKPLVIEEIFPLKCDAETLARFIDRSRPYASGWIGFYWGTQPAEYRESADTLPAALALSWLELFQAKTPQILPGYRNVGCEGSYPHHLQGVCVDDASIYWSFTTQLVKTDLSGNRIASVPVANHHGDLCLHGGKLFVAVNLGEFNNPAGNADSWVYVYDTETLQEVARHETQEVVYGAGGIGSHEGRFYLVGGLPREVEENYVYEYDDSFAFVAKHTIDSGHTFLGIQTAAFAHGRWWFGCYGDPQVLLVTDAAFRLQGRYELDCSLGIAGLPGGQCFVATGRCAASAGCTGRVRVAIPDEAEGLRILESDKTHE